jgi:glycosidase
MKKTLLPLSILFLLLSWSRADSIGLAAPPEGANDGNIQWDELYHNASSASPTQEFVPDEAYTFRDVHTSGNVYDDTSVNLTILTSQYELDGAYIKTWDGSANQWIGMAWHKNWTGLFRGAASHTYDVWRGTIPTHAAGITLSYRIQLYDSGDYDYLVASGGDYANPRGQSVEDDEFGGSDWSYTVLDDDTTGPSFSSVSWNSGTHLICADVYDAGSASGDNDSGVYDDATGSGGQGMYLKWDSTKATVDGGGGTEAQLSLSSGNTYCTVSTINPGGQFYFRISAYNNDYDNSLTGDREQDNSGTRASLGGGASVDGDVWWNEVFHNTRNIAYRSPFGAVPTGQAVTIQLRTAAGDLGNAALVIYNTESGTVWDVQGTPSSGDAQYDYYTFTIPAQSSTRTLYYKFRLQDSGDCDWYVDDHAHNSYDHEDRYENGTGLMVVGKSGDPCADSHASVADNSFNITVYDAAAYTTLPGWAQEAVIYQILPDRFRNGDTSNDSAWPYGDVYGNPIYLHPDWNAAPCNPRAADGGDGGGGCEFQEWSADFFGGDIQGIIDQLDYFESLGVTALYLNPIFASPSNHGYDTTDYLSISPRFGSNALFQTLNTEAEARGIKIILDGVFNHTGSDSVYFDRANHWDASGNAVSGANGSGACESQSSMFNLFYTFLSGSGPCTGRTDGYQQYNSWWGYDTLPLLNENNTVKDFLFDDDNDGDNGVDARQAVIQFWYALGADGWRFDVADEISHSFWQGFRDQVKDTDNLYGPLYTEVWYEANSFLYGDQLDATMNYRYRKAVLGFLIDTDWTDNDNANDSIMWALSPSQFDYALNSIREDYPAPAWYAMMNLMGSHDTNRALFVLREKSTSLATALAKMKMMAALQFTYPGAPTVYYGDEAGIGAADYGGNAKWGAGASDNGILQDDPYNRHPYPWTDEDGTLAAGLPNASLQAAYRLLALTRNNYDVLQTGGVTTLLTDDTNDLYAYARTDSNGAPACALAVFNRGSGAQAVSLTLPAACSGLTFHDVLNGGTAYTASGTALTGISVAELSSAVLVPPFDNPNTPDSAPSLPPAGAILTAGDTGIPVSSSSILSALISDVNGNALPAGVTVNFAILSGGGSLSASSAVTNGSGVAAVTFNAPASGDVTVIQASIAAPGGVVYSGSAIVFTGLQADVADVTSVEVGIGPESVSLPGLLTVDKAGRGEPVISLTEFDNVANASGNKSAYVDVHLTSAANVDSLAVTLTYTDEADEANHRLYWHDGTGWNAIPGSTVNAAANTVSFTVTSATTPSLANLTGTGFVVGGAQTPTAVGLVSFAARGGGAGWGALAAGVLVLGLLGGLWLWRGRRAVSVAQ